MNIEPKAKKKPFNLYLNEANTNELKIIAEKLGYSLSEYLDKVIKTLVDAEKK